MTGLPKGWVEATVGELIGGNGLFVDGDWVESKDQDPAGDVRLTQLADVGDGKWRDRSDRRMTSAAAEELRCTQLAVGDVLVARMPDPLGRACLFPGDGQPCVTVVDVAVVRPGRGSVRHDWLMWTINSPGTRAAIEAQQGGTTRKRISRKNLGAITVPVPPLAEQHRIVAAIEEAFSKLDAGEAGLRTVRRLLKRMRDAVLAAAVTGRLVPQDPTDTPAAELLAEMGIEPLVARDPAGALAAGRLADVGVEPGDDSALPLIPAGWSWATLGQLAHGAGYGTSVKCGYEECGVGVLRIPNIRRGCVDMSDLKRAPASVDVGDDMLVAPGDLLLVRTNGSRDLIGRCAPVTRELRCSFASYLIRFRMHLAAVDVEYVSLLLGAPAWRHRLEAGSASSAGQYNLSLRTLEPLPVPLPPLAEQLRIVAEVERQLSDLDACERAVDTALARAAALRRSVLKAAFEGRLVAQDPSDEPASVLLDRIRAEREAEPKPARRRRAGSVAKS